MDLLKHKPKLNTALSNLAKAKRDIADVYSEVQSKGSSDAVTDGFMTSIDSGLDDTNFAMDNIQDAIEWIEESEEDEEDIFFIYEEDEDEEE